MSKTAESEFRTDQGAILIVVLWLVSILSILATGIAYAQRVETRVARNWIDRARARAVAGAGVETAISALHAHGRDKSHMPSSEWWSGMNRYGGIKVGDGNFTVVPELGRGRTGGGGGAKDEVYGLADEESRINVNNVTEKILAALKGMNKGLARAIVRKRKELLGNGSSGESLVTTLAEARQEKKAKQGAVLNRPFASLRDLMAVPGITSALLFGDGKGRGGLSRYLTASSNGKVNVNSAPKEVLQAFGIKPRALEVIEKTRTGGGKGFRSIDKFLIVSGLLKPGKGGNKSGAPDPEQLKRKQELKKLLDVRSCNFRLVSMAQVGRSPRVAIHARLTLAKERIRITRWQVEYLPPQKRKIAAAKRGGRSRRRWWSVTVESADSAGAPAMQTQGTPRRHIGNMATRSNEAAASRRRPAQRVSFWRIASALALRTDLPGRFGAPP